MIAKVRVTESRFYVQFTGQKPFSCVNFSHAGEDYCFAWWENDFYLMASEGRKIRLDRKETVVDLTAFQKID